MLYQVCTVARQHVYDRNLYHCITTWLQTFRCTGYIDQHLSSQCRIINLHIEFQALVLCLSTDALAYQMYTVSHVAHVINTLHLEHMRFIVGEIGVGLDVFGDLL